VTTVLYLAGGFAALLAGSELLVRGAVALARHLRVSPLLIGLTVVGFGTSVPELVTSVEAARLGSPGIAVGNIVGSNICNILLILGLAAVLRPIPVRRATVVRDGGVMLLAALAVAALVPLGALLRPVGLVFLAALAAYLTLAYRRERAAPDPQAGDREPPKRRLALAIPALLVGLMLAVLGAHLFVVGAIELARLLHISESIIGLTVAAVGTSLPELATSVVAVIRRQPDIAYGNIVGSNIFNVFGILGVTALVKPIALPHDIAGFDVWVMLAASAALIAASVTGWRLTRGEGASFLAAYGGYLAVLAARA
jgi:cation:H+ antiporter